MAKTKERIAAVWLRRDLRLDDNTALENALATGLPVLLIFIFDRSILDKLADKDDARLTFIHGQLSNMHQELRARHASSIWTYHGQVHDAWNMLVGQFDIERVFYNRDYEPYAKNRDLQVEQFLQSNGIMASSFKDQVIFEGSDVLKGDGKPYTVYTPYKNKWLLKLKENEHILCTVNQPQASFLPLHLSFPDLGSIGFEKSRISLPSTSYQDCIEAYGHTRNFPAQPHGTTRIGIHLRFGTLSIRKVVKDALAAADHTWLSELIWREFFMMVLHHFPETTHQAFKKEYDNIKWRNDEGEFAMWCKGETGYPLVDAGMRELNQSGHMHNRVRMVVASFLCKHLLIDWRWGEAYFARKLLDYDQSSNVGNWQWAAGCGTDAAPYFRVFNPELQAKRFDPEGKYIKKWVPDFTDPFHYPKPMVDHKKARERILETYKKALKD